MIGAELASRAIPDLEVNPTLIQVNKKKGIDTMTTACMIDYSIFGWEL